MNTPKEQNRAPRPFIRRGVSRCRKVRRYSLTYRKHMKKLLCFFHGHQFFAAIYRGAPARICMVCGRAECEQTLDDEIINPNPRTKWTLLSQPRKAAAKQ